MRLLRPLVLAAAAALLTSVLLQGSAGADQERRVSVASSAVVAARGALPLYEKLVEVRLALPGDLDCSAKLSAQAQAHVQAMSDRDGLFTDLENHVDIDGLPHSALLVANGSSDPTLVINKWFHTQRDTLDNPLFDAVGTAYLDDGVQHWWAAIFVTSGGVDDPCRTSHAAPVAVG